MGAVVTGGAGIWGAATTGGAVSHGGGVGGQVNAGSGAQGIGDGGTNSVQEPAWRILCPVGSMAGSLSDAHPAAAKAQNATSHSRVHANWRHRFIVECLPDSYFKIYLTSIKVPRVLAT